LREHNTASHPLCGGYSDIECVEAGIAWRVRIMNNLNTNSTPELLENVLLGASGVGVSGPSNLLHEFKISQRDVLDGVLNEFSDKEIAEQRREEFVKRFESGILDEFRDLLKDSDTPLDKLTLDEVREFLKKRFELTEGKSRSVTLDLIDEIRKEGLGERLEVKLLSVRKDFQEEKKGSSSERNSQLDELMETISADFEGQKRDLGKIDLADESRYKGISQELLDFFRNVDDKIGRLEKET
jgi:hypothetical protein